MPTFLLTGTGTPGVIDASLVSGITDIVTQNVGVLLPIGITILGVMIGISLIPRIVYKFF